MVVAATGTAHADDCAALGGVLAGGECQIPNAVTASDSAHGGPFTIDETLRIKGTGSIAVPPVKTGSSLTLLVTGNIIMDLPTVSGGGQIIGDNPLSGGVGATITVRATGDITLSGNGTVGAQISSNQGTSGCDDGRGGDIKLAAGGVFTLQKGAQITSIATCPGGNIAMTAGLSADIDGVVRTETKTTHGIGGRITITAGCTLTVGDAGQVVSTGRQTAGNRVHLEGGCAVLIQGLVASNGPGRDEKGLSQCHTPDRLDKPQDARGCIEVWSGGTLKIDSSSTHNAELNADTATSFAVTCCHGSICSPRATSPSSATAPAPPRSTRIRPCPPALAG